MKSDRHYEEIAIIALLGAIVVLWLLALTTPLLDPDTRGHAQPKKTPQGQPAEATPQPLWIRV